MINKSDSKIFKDKMNINKYSYKKRNKKFMIKIQKMKIKNN